MGIIYHAAIRCLKVKDTTQVNTDINDGLPKICDYIIQAKKNISKFNRMVKIEGARKGTLIINNGIRRKCRLNIETMFEHYPFSPELE